MRSSKKRYVSLLLLCCTLKVSGAVTPEDGVVSVASEAPAVIVKGIRDPDWKSYSAMLKGVEKFREKNTSPTAKLQFMLVPRRPDVDMDGLELMLEGDQTRIAIPLERGNIFALPVDKRELYAKAELTINRKAGSVKWLPYVRSAATTTTMRRLGDLRVACEVHWAIDKETLPFAARTTISALGGPCNFISKRGSYSFSEAQPIVSATITFSGKSELIPVSNFSFTPPLRDSRWRDESIVELHFGAADPKGNVPVRP